MPTQEELNYQLWIACHQQTLAQVEEAIARGADVNAWNDYEHSTPLHEAARRGRNDIAEVLLRHGADVNAQEQDEKGWRIAPLHRAVEFNHADTVELLLKHHANVNIQDNRWQQGWTPLATPLHYAAKNGNDDIVRILLRHDAQINAEDEQGHTPIYSALSQSHKDTALVLLEQGAKWEYLAGIDGWDARDFMGNVNAAIANVNAALTSDTFEPSQRETLSHLSAMAENDPAERAAMISFMMRVNYLGKTFDKAHAETWSERLLANALAYNVQHGEPLSWKSLVTPFSRERIIDCSNVRDMMYQFAQFVLMPAFVASLMEKDGVDTPYNRKVFEALKPAQSDIMEKLQPIAADALLGALPPHQILGLSRAWHHPRSEFP